MTQTFKERFQYLLKEDFMKSLSKRGLKVDTAISEGFFQLILDSLEEALNSAFETSVKEFKTISKDNGE